MPRGERRITGHERRVCAAVAAPCPCAEVNHVHISDIFELPLTFLHQLLAGYPRISAARRAPCCWPRKLHRRSSSCAVMLLYLLPDAALIVCILRIPCIIASPLTFSMKISAGCAEISAARRALSHWPRRTRRRSSSCALSLLSKCVASISLMSSNFR